MFELSNDPTTITLSVYAVARWKSSMMKKSKRRQRIVAEDMGFELTDHSLNMYGLCPDCRS